MPVHTSQGWRAGPENSIDRMIERGHDVTDIPHVLHVPRWLVVERFAARLTFEAPR